MDHPLDYLRDHPFHPIIETILAWMVAILCLFYYGYQYLSSSLPIVRPFLPQRRQLRHTPSRQTIRKRRIPLMTEANVTRMKHIDPIDQVQVLYQHITKELGSTVLGAVLNNSNTHNSLNVSSSLWMSLPKDKVIETIRTNATLRRWVSQYTIILTSLPPPPPQGMMIEDTTTTTSATATDKNTTTNNNNYNEDSTISRHPSRITLEMKQLYTLFDSIWTDLLRLPSSTIPTTNITTGTTYTYTITLIIPLYQECGTNVIETTLRVAWQHCRHPKGIQIILVDAGQCRNVSTIHDYIQQHKRQQQQQQQQQQDRPKDQNDQSNEPPLPPTQQQQQQQQHNWGDIQYVEYKGGGGRGPCQNYGAQWAQGRYLTFLHSDTLIPYHWDIKIQTALECSRTSRHGTTVVTHACSFSVGHNVSKEGLETTMRYPYGIRSILLLGNIRAWLFRLPYGDHILSFHTNHFHFIGGFPHQPIMEDYAIMDLLRQRAAVVPQVETLRIIPPPTGLCSVRRWQKYGVVYVTLVNALIVHRYAYGGWTADDVFSYYYQRPLKQKTQ